MSSVFKFREAEPCELPPLIGSSPAIQLARRRIEQFARSAIPVLLVGPTGSGKELLAQHLHAQSGRPGELVDVNCGALPRDMIESLLFGHRKGAFTGASESTTGHIARANHGTLFLDELSSLPPEGQAKLLRVLETGEVLPLGESRKHKCDFRVIGAVQEDVEARVSSGLFRRDLFYRIAGVRLTIPPLCERQEDIPLLASHFASIHGCTITQDALVLLRVQTWPGNVRELRGVTERAVVLTDGHLIDRGAVEMAIAIGTGACERQVGAKCCLQVRGNPEEVLRACIAKGWRSNRIAGVLGVSRATLFRRLRSLGLSLNSLRVSQSQAVSESRETT
jgi:DNA-binding NtrC family response regulator